MSRYKLCKFNFLVTQLRLFVKIPRPNEAINNLQGRIDYLNSLGLVEYTPNGIIFLTDEGKEYFED